MHSDPLSSLMPVATSYHEAHWFLSKFRDQLRDADFTKPWELICRPYKTTRSLEQNKRYWALMGEVAEQMAAHMDGVYHAPESWHEIMKKRFLGYDVMEVEGATYEVPKSSRKLKVDEFADFMTQVEAWAIEQGVMLW